MRSEKLLSSFHPRTLRNILDNGTYSTLREKLLIEKILGEKEKSENLEELADEFLKSHGINPRNLEEL